MHNIFDQVDAEKEKIYREVEKHYIIEDITRQIFENILSDYIADGNNAEDIPDDVWNLCKMDAIYECWTQNNDANLSHWDNINNAINTVFTKESRNAAIDACKALPDEEEGQ